MLKTHTYDKINIKKLKLNFLHKTSPYTIFHSRQATLHTIQPILGCQSQYFILHCRQSETKYTQNNDAVIMTSHLHAIKGGRNTVCDYNICLQILRWLTIIFSV